MGLQGIACRDLPAAPGKVAMRLVRSGPEDTVNVELANIQNAKEANEPGSRDIVGDRNDTACANLS